MQYFILFAFLFAAGRRHIVDVYLTTTYFLREPVRFNLLVTIVPCATQRMHLQHFNLLDHITKLIVKSEELPQFNFYFPIIEPQAARGGLLNLVPKR